MNQLGYTVGGLLYTPATNGEIAAHIINGDWEHLTSVSLCLEDSIQDAGLMDAEAQLKRTLRLLRQCKRPLPKLFVRVRNPEHLLHVQQFLDEETTVLSGYIFPKFDLDNAVQYLDTLRRINEARPDARLYAMPILESRMIADIRTRREALFQLRRIVDERQDDILNIRVGGNDFCNSFGLRRSVRQTIYDIGVVREILMDILNVFSDDYVVSGPVWEYYGQSTDEAWALGLRRELELDRANGFFGKTAIHPSQLPLIHESMQVTRADYEDAMQILSWSDPVRAVQGSRQGRMNEQKCHTKWAERIKLRAEFYGIREK